VGDGIGGSEGGCWTFSLGFSSFSFSSLTELPPSPPCEVETEACFLFLIRGTSSSSSSSSWKSKENMG
jgi:hypothetical protein